MTVELTSTGYRTRRTLALAAAWACGFAWVVWQTPTVDICLSGQYVCDDFGGGGASIEAFVLLLVIAGIVALVCFGAMAVARTRTAVFGAAAGLAISLGLTAGEWVARWWEAFGGGPYLSIVEFLIIRAAVCAGFGAFCGWLARERRAVGGG